MKQKYQKCLREHCQDKYSEYKEDIPEITPEILKCLKDPKTKAKCLKSNTKKNKTKQTKKHTQKIRNRK